MTDYATGEDTMKRLLWAGCFAVIAATALDALLVGSDWSLVGVGILMGVALSVPIALLAAIPGKRRAMGGDESSHPVDLIEAEFTQSQEIEVWS